MDFSTYIITTYFGLILAMHTAKVLGMTAKELNNEESENAAEKVVQYLNNLQTESRRERFERLQLQGDFKETKKALTDTTKWLLEKVQEEEESKRNMIEKFEQDNYQLSENINVLKRNDEKLSQFIMNEMHHAFNLACSGDGYYYTPEIGCYKIYNHEKDWTAARDFCNKEGADLAIIHSETEAEVLAQKYQNQNSRSWIGVKYEENDWMTLNGQHLKETGYDQWFYKNDDHTPKQDHCLILYFDIEKQGLDKSKCESLVPSFICKKTTHQVVEGINKLLEYGKQTKETIEMELQKKIELKISKKLDDFKRTCEENITELKEGLEQLFKRECYRINYTYTPKIGCHKLYTSIEKWTEARKICQKDGADLAIINSQEEAKVAKILKIEANTLSDYLWIGFGRFREIEWLTSDVKTLEEDEVFIRKLRNNICLASMFDDSNLFTPRDHSCDSNMPFICELSTF